ncbi:MAG: hypothetical protein WB507_06125 [Solirubrobacterales bacterium]
MEDSVEQALIWKQEPLLGGLFVLHVDGRAVADCAVTDRARSREEQIQTLAEAEWIPPQQLSALFEAIDKESQPRPSMTVLEGERRISPLRGGFAATIDADEQPSEHPVRRYLFPSIERSGALALEPGESILMSWKSYNPNISALKTADNSLINTEPIPSAMLRKWRCVLTDRRLIYHGKLDPPKAMREDYPSIFLPQTVFEGIATYRQIKRWATRPNLHWAFHLRHEWLCDLGFGNRPDKKKPLLLRRDDTLFIQAGFRYPSGDRGVFRIPYKQTEPQIQDVGEVYAQTVRNAQPQLTIADPVKQVDQGSSESIFSAKPDREALTTWAISGGVPWSLPPTLNA